MTIPQVVDGVTDADAAFMNQLVDAANQANAAFNGAGQITTAAITPALEGYKPLDSLRAPHINALDFAGIDPTGATSSSAGLAAMATAAGAGQAQGYSGLPMIFPPGEYVLTETLVLDQFAGKIIGSGVGNSPLIPYLS